MPPLKCACLVARQGESLLLVRVRQNLHWYLPGGKIEDHELPEAALQRELAEELGIELIAASIRYLYTVTGPAYGLAGEVELICFSAQWDGQVLAQREISEVKWLPLQDQARFAPAVQILCRDYL
jgi:8-oxo-dGTP diphosphatase